jgi:hypothetical protein
MEVDLHVHSRFSSDCASDPKEIVSVARKLGLDGVAIVDHGSIEGGLLGMQYARDDFIVVPGMEVATPLGDVLGLFIHSPIESDDPERVMREIRGQGGVVVLPHPYFSKFLKYPELLGKFDAMEVCNGRHQMDTDKTVEEAMLELEKIAEEHGLTPLGGSDAHSCAEIGVATTIIPAETLEDLRAVILDGPTIVKHRGATKFRKVIFGI